MADGRKMYSEDENGPSVGGSTVVSETANGFASCPYLHTSLFPFPAGNPSPSHGPTTYLYSLLETRTRVRDSSTLNLEGEAVDRRPAVVGIRLGGSGGRIRRGMDVVGSVGSGLVSGAWW